MERKIFEGADLKINNDGTGTISGYASTFANWDRVRPIPERPAKGAFAPYLGAFIKDGFIALGHDWGALPIATPTNAKEDDYGLWFEAAFHSTTMAQEARITANERIARGKSVATSIGYNVLDDEYVHDDASLPDGIDMGRILKAIPLYEISMVTVPANPLALLTGAKELLETGGTFDAQALMVETAVRAFAKRAQSRYDARAKEGRVLSAANRDKLGNLKTSLADVLAIIEELLAAGDPGKSLSDLNAEYLRFLTLEAITNGVNVHD